MDLTWVYQNIFTWWKATGVICPCWHILDHKAPEKLKTAICDKGCRVELMLSDQNRRNPTKLMIQTFKSHFISVLACVSDNFPIHQCDKLLPKTILTFNLLRQTSIAPNISVHSYHHGSFYYICMLLAPKGVQFSFTLSQAEENHKASIPATSNLF